MSGLRAIHAARLFTGEEMRCNAVLVIENGRVRDVSDPVPPNAVVERLPDDLILAPGFIDLQVNGGGGVLFNDSPTPAALRVIAAAHRRFGTTAFLPTLITDRFAKMRDAASAVRNALESREPGILGLHLEGPFLNPLRKGVHDAALIRIPTEDDLQFLCKQTPRPLVVTLAPEIVGADMLAQLARAGVTICMGHSAATYDQAIAALDAGAHGFTHLFNAMPPLTGRDPGLLGVGLADSRGVAGIIADGHHVHPANLRLAFRARGDRGLALVTDAMPSVGTDLRTFELQGRRVRVENGRLLTEDGVLAGAHLDMASAIRNAMTFMGATLPEALRMASMVPADLLGVTDRGRLLPGSIADAIAIDAALHVHRVWIAGVA